MPITARPGLLRGAGLSHRAVVLRMAAVALVVLIVHAAGLWSLVRHPQSSGPLVILVLVPAAAAAVGWQRAVRGHHGPRIHDRQLDYIMGAGLAVVALTLLLVQDTRRPALSGARLDLLALPLTAAAAAVLLVGTRMTWQLRAALGVLLLTWPPPWEALTRLLAGPLVALVQTSAEQLAGIGGGSRPEPAASIVVTAGGGATGHRLLDLPLGGLGSPLIGVFAGLLLALVLACSYGGSRMLRATVVVIGAVVGGVVEALSVSLSAVVVQHGYQPQAGSVLGLTRQGVVLLATAVLLAALGRGLSRLPRGLQRPRRLDVSPVVGQIKDAVPRGRLAFGVLAVVAGVCVISELAAAAAP